MNVDNLLKEGNGDGRGGVWMAQGDEVCVFGEVIHHCQDHGFSARLREPLDEVHA
jgi:hypothetical protein